MATPDSFCALLVPLMPTLFLGSESFPGKRAGDDQATQSRESTLQGKRAGSPMGWHTGKYRLCWQERPQADQQLCHQDRALSIITFSK